MKLNCLFNSIFSALVVLLAAGCVIEKAEVIPPVERGSVYITLHDSVGNAIDSAQISLDDSVTAYLTPDTLENIPVGRYWLGAYRAGYEPTFDSVEIFSDSVSVVALVTVPAILPPPVIELVAAPDSTVLLLNAHQYSMAPPTLFDSITVGSYAVSAYLAGYATALPAQWMVNLQLGDTARLPVQFNPLAEGSQPSGLAPVFSLADDRDSTIYHLQDYRGRVILITFFFVDCAPCLAEMPSIQAVYSDPAYAGQIEFFGIDPNDPYFAFSFYRITHGGDGFVSFPLLYGLNQGVKEAYDVVPFPTNFIIDQTGTIRYRWGGLTEAQLREAVNALLAENP